MQFRTTGLLLLGAMVLPTSGIAQTTPAPPAITRTVVAATKLPTVTDVPLHFEAVSITLQPDEKSGVSAANGIRYQMSGSTEVSLDGEAKMLSAGEGLFIAGGKTAALMAGSGGPSTFLFPSPRCGLWSACRNGTCRRERAISHCDSNPRPEARRLLSQSHTSHISGTHALQPAPPSVRSGSVLYYFWHRSEHGRRSDRSQGTRF